MPRKAKRFGGKSKRKDGRIDASITIETPLGPKRLRTTRATEEEADEWLSQMRQEADAGYLSHDARKVSVGAFVGRWLEDEVRPGIRRITYVDYEKTYRLRIEPYIGGIRLSKLTPQHVSSWRQKMLRDGHTPQESRKAMTLLKRALTQAVAWQMLPRNPAEHVKRPTYRPKETGYIRAADVGKYLAATRDDPYHALFVIAALAGPRPAELLALRWDDYDEAAGTLRVDESVSVVGGIPDFNEPKTERGRRLVPLPADARRALSEHRRRFLERRMSTGERGDPEKALVFPRGDDLSKPYGIDALRHRWYAIQRRAGLPRMTLYALRHTAVTLQARIGTDLRTTAGMMGHADIKTTANIYSHYEEDRGRAAMNKLDDLLSGSDEA